MSIRKVRTPVLIKEYLVDSEGNPVEIGGDSVKSVNGQTGVVTLTASDIGAEAGGTAQALLEAYTVSWGDIQSKPAYIASGADQQAVWDDLRDNSNNLATSSRVGLMSIAFYSKLSNLPDNADLETRLSDIESRLAALEGASA